MNPLEHMLNVWRIAALDLQFKLIAPFELYDGIEKVSCFALVPEFGSSKGMVIFTEFVKENCKLATSQGYGYTCLSVSDEPYCREDFESMLSDWGCTGEKPRA